MGGGSWGPAATLIADSSDAAAMTSAGFPPFSCATTSEVSRHRSLGGLPCSESEYRFASASNIAACPAMICEYRSHTSGGSSGYGLPGHGGIVGQAIMAQLPR